MFDFGYIDSSIVCLDVWIIDLETLQVAQLKRLFVLKLITI